MGRGGLAHHRAARGGVRHDADVAAALRRSDLGGQILFGTDVGYMTEYDPTDEYVFMQEAGLSYPRILASLTTAPAARFGAVRSGRLAPGFDADVVVVDGDPAADIRVLAKGR